MSRKLLMIASAIVMGVIGFIFLFMPEEVLHALNQALAVIPALIIQLMGALYFGFAIMNWMAKTVLIGGIYAKPLSLGNFAHFFIGALTLIKITFNNHLTAKYIWVFTFFYIIFAIAFGIVSFSSPKIKAKVRK